MLFCKEGKIESNKVHRIIIKQRNFDSLANGILTEKESPLTQSKKT